MKSCCFIGHRNAELSVKEKEYLVKTIENLINTGADKFLFGSNSKFNDVCCEIVTRLQHTYKHIKIIGYPCGSEHFCLKKEKFIQNIALKVIGKDIKINFFDEVVDNKCIGKGAYILRNEKMIDDSDVCVFYYDLSYKYTKSKSGTQLAFDYAKKKKKSVINIKEL